MSIVYPEIIYPEEDSPPNSELVIVDYIQEVSSVIRLAGTLYATFPIGMHWGRILGIDLGDGMFSAQPFTVNSAESSWTGYLSVNGHESFEYPEWESIGTSELAAAGIPVPSNMTTQTITIETFASIGPYGHGEASAAEWGVAGMIQLWGSYVGTTYLMKKSLTLEYGLFKQEVFAVEEIVTMIPIFALLLLSQFALFTTASLPNIIPTRRRKRT